MGRTTHSPHLEEVGEVGLVADRQRELDLSTDEAAHHQPLVAGAVVEHLGPRQVERAVREATRAATEVRVRQIEGQAPVVALGAGAEQQRPMPSEAQHQARKVAGAAVVDPLLAETFGSDVSVPIEDRERLAVLEDLVVGVGQLRAGLDLVACLPWVPYLGRPEGIRVSQQRWAPSASVCHAVRGRCRRGR
jgi:hypothetical protein